MTVATPAFGRGGDSAQDADEALASSRGGNFRKTNYLPNIGPGNSIFLRYLLDSPEWYYMNAHPSAPTKSKPADWPDKATFPTSMPAVCRHDKAFKGIYTDCYICDAKLVNEWKRECKPVVRVWTLACIREEVLGSDDMVAKGMITADKVGKRVGFKDATREVEETDNEGKPTGKKTIEPALIVVNKAVSNYFGGLQSMFGIYGTVCDRDYVVLQKGEKKDVEFHHIPLEPSPSLKPGEPAWDRYTQAIKDQDLSIEAMLMDRSSDDFFATFFDPSKTPAPRASRGGTQATTSAPPQQQAAAPSNDADPDALKAMRDRVRGATPAVAETVKDAPAQQPVADAGTIDFSS